MVLATLRRLAAELRSVLSDLDPERLSGPDALRLLEAFTDLEKLAAGGKLLTARRVESSKVWRTRGHRSAAAQIAEAAGTGLGPATGTLKAARQLGTLPAAEAAVRRGRLSEVQVREVAGAASQSPEAEGDLLEAAAQEPVEVLQLRCRRAKAKGAEPSRRYRAIHRSRYLRHWVDEEGAVRLDAKLTPDAGARLVGAVRTECERLGAEAASAEVTEPVRARLADALVGLACRPTGTAPRGGRGGRGKGQAATEGEGGEGPPAVVHVRVDHAALVRGQTEAGEVCEIEGIGPVPVEVARALAADSILSVLVTKGVDVTAVAHLGRTVPASLRRALLERDPTCVVPGCEVSEGLEIDHLVPFGQGGTTTLANLARLCRYHHYLKTHQGHRLERHGRRWLWIPPPRPTPTPRLC